MDGRFDFQSQTNTHSRTYRAVFFDLDGTLLPMELEGFIDSYFRSITHFVAEQGLDTTAFLTGFKAGMGAMASHEDDRTNHDVYWETFFRHVASQAVDWEALLSRFYDNDFGEVGTGVVPDPAAARAVSTLIAKGYPLVLTTMPLFPLHAVEWRLRWAGIDPGCFMRLTSYENSTSVKPKLAYYAENLAACGVSGGDVLMVGNNTLEDLSALGVGTDAFLITDNLLDPVGYDMDTVKNGTMTEFAGWAESLPVCVDPASKIELGVVNALTRTTVLKKNMVKLDEPVARKGEGAASQPCGRDGKSSVPTTDAVTVAAANRVAATEEAGA